MTPDSPPIRQGFAREAHWIAMKLSSDIVKKLIYEFKDGEYKIDEMVTPVIIVNGKPLKPGDEVEIGIAIDHSPDGMRHRRRVNREKKRRTDQFASQRAEALERINPSGDEDE